MLFDSPQSLFRILLAAITAYAALILLLRLSGKRSLAKLNAFDFVITIALGSMLASFVLSKDVTFADGLLGLAMLLGLQFALSWMSVKSARVKRMVRSRPRLLLRDGRFDDAALARERITRGEALAAMRKDGVGRIEDAGALVLETDGSFSVVRSDQQAPLTCLRDVEGAAENRDVGQSRQS
jgi:uncharacterized membrane protein YcaP (DUF421 family)